MRIAARGDGRADCARVRHCDGESACVLAEQSEQVGATGSVSCHKNRDAARQDRDDGGGRDGDDGDDDAQDA